MSGGGGYMFGRGYVLGTLQRQKTQYSNLISSCMRHTTIVPFSSFRSSIYKSATYTSFDGGGGEGIIISGFPVDSLFFSRFFGF